MGPEVIAGAWVVPSLFERCRPVVFGRPEILRRAVALWKIPVEVREIDDVAQAEPSPGVMPCLPCGPVEAADVPPGVIDARSGQAAFDAVVAAAQLARAGRLDAITTAPLHKEALHRAGHNYPGHTELLAELCGVDEFAMMLYLGPDDQLGPPDGLAVVHVTLHTAMKEVFAQLSEDAVLVKIRLADAFMTRLSGRRPRIGVCALNPHGGEGGLFGDEEISTIRPAIRRACGEGIHAAGPLPADTLLIHARDGLYDAVVAMYHDQGHIALKLLGMHRAVNVTLGLPIVRTSVAHGTAFDIAWKAKANPNSMLEAVRVAVRLAK